MTDCAALIVKRNVVSCRVDGSGRVWLSGCSADATRFAPMAIPSPIHFRRPRTTPRRRRPMSRRRRWRRPADPELCRRGAPQSGRRFGAADVLARDHGTDSPVGRPAGQGSAVGWTAVGGSPIIVAEGDSLDGLSRRYGVPAAALLSANGLSSSSQVHGGMRIVVPVYNAGGKTGAEPVATSRQSETDVRKRRLRSQEGGEKSRTRSRRAEKAKHKAKKKSSAKSPKLPTTQPSRSIRRKSSAKADASDDAPSRSTR